MSERRIAHLDMDAFFASCELLRYPQLKDQAVVIGGRGQGDLHASQDLAQLPLSAFARLRDYQGRGVITTATYAARQFGVGSAMGMMKAAKLCPDAILLPADFERYREYSRRFKAIITDIAPVMENRGIDEVYIDFTEVPGGQRDRGRSLARLIQREIFLQTGLTCSVGVAPNKLLAKLASEMDKPNGITVLGPEDVPTRIWPMACRRLNGIGPKADARLQAMGLHTLGEVAQADVLSLQTRLGRRYGAWLHQACNGIDDRPVEVSSEPVSMSRETTFERDLHPVHDREVLGAVFTRLCAQVASDLQRKGYVGKTVGIKLRDDRFQTATRDSTHARHTDEAAVIRRWAGEALKRAPLDRPLRLLGVRVASLQRKSELAQAPESPGEQAELFD
jgi:DNA polymerase-4